MRPQFYLVALSSGFIMSDLSLSAYKCKTFHNITLYTFEMNRMHDLGMSKYPDKYATCHEKYSLEVVFLFITAAVLLFHP